MNKKRKVILIMSIILVLVLIAALYFQFIFTIPCKDESCFNANLEICERANYLNELKDATWQYKIIGKSGNSCEIEVHLLQIKQGIIETGRLEGETMNCFMTLGVVDAPEKDISKCHGLLKEELQNIIIQKLHSYILSNIGEVSDELNKVI